MKHKLFAALTLAFFSTLGPQLSTLLAQGTAFTYEGRLDDNGNPAGGICDLRFAIYDHASTGTVVAGPVEAGDAGMTNGRFTLTLDFGANVFDGGDRWLDIAITLDARGEAVVAMPDWFSALNKEFRYQLTCLGGFAPVFIAEEIAGNRFKIAGGRSGLKVFWQVTGVRQDAWANAHRIPIEEDKSTKERGSYLHPEVFGQPAEKSVEGALHPEMMPLRKERPTDSTPERQEIAPNPESLSP